MPRVSPEGTEVGTGGPLVVFVHGVLGHGRSFDRVAALLEDADRALTTLGQLKDADRLLAKKAGTVVDD